MNIEEKIKWRGVKNKKLSASIRNRKYQKTFPPRIFRRELFNSGETKLKRNLLAATENYTTRIYCNVRRKK